MQKLLRSIFFLNRTNSSLILQDFIEIRLVIYLIFVATMVNRVSTDGLGHGFDSFMYLHLRCHHERIKVPIQLIHPIYLLNYTLIVWATRLMMADFAQRCLLFCLILLISDSAAQRPVSHSRVPRLFLYFSIFALNVDHVLFEMVEHLGWRRLSYWVQGLFEFVFYNFKWISFLNYSMRFINIIFYYQQYFYYLLLIFQV